MKVKLKEVAHHPESADHAVDALRDRCSKFHPNWTATGVAVNRVQSPSSWRATATLEKEVEW